MAGLTEEKIELIKVLWAAGLSGGAIAAELGEGITRSAVLGKIHRLGLQRNKNYAPRAPRPPRVRRLRGAPNNTVVSLLFERDRAEQDAAKAAAVATEPPAEVEAPAEAPPGGVQLADLLDHHCRFPIGDPKTDADFHFCGAERMRERYACGTGTIRIPYCRVHYLVAHRKRSTVESEADRQRSIKAAQAEKKAGGFFKGAKTHKGRGVAVKRVKSLKLKGSANGKAEGFEEQAEVDCGRSERGPAIENHAGARYGE